MKKYLWMLFAAVVIGALRIYLSSVPYLHNVKQNSTKL